MTQMAETMTQMGETMTQMDHPQITQITQMKNVASL